MSGICLKIFQKRQKEKRKDKEDVATVDDY